MQIHSDPEYLLRYADKELSSVDAESVAEHLRDCEGCRAELVEMRAALSEYDRYHHATLKWEIPEPPAAWPDLTFELIKETPKRASSRVYRWAGIAAGLFLMASPYQFSPQSKIDAAELLSQASSRSAEPAVNQRIRFKVGNRSFIRHARMAGASDTGFSDEVAGLRAVFQQANFSWEEPFSARSFAQWRKQLPQKEDHVRIVSAVGERIGRFYEVTTTTSSGILFEANLTLTVGDLHPVSETLKFRDRDWV